MTAPARIKQADLKRIATIAKREGVRIKVEMDGWSIEVYPNPDLPPQPLQSPLEQWKADRERRKVLAGT